MRLEIVSDVNIPCAKAAFNVLGRIRVMPAEAITHRACRSSDLLLVRSVTRVDASLLTDSRVRFVGSATAGTEHIDTAYLARQGIAFAHAPGSNAASVVEYVLTALLNLSSRFDRPLTGLTLGVIGCGHIGGQVAARARAFGMTVLKNDPPLQDQGVSGLVSLSHVLAASDIVTLHVPLTAHTHHLVGREFLSRLRPGAWLINTSRGAVVNTPALKGAISGGQIGAVVLDVWEREPFIDVDLLRMVTLATPHIAGYSFDGKIAGTVMLYKAAIECFGFADRWDYAALLKPDSPVPLPAPDLRLPALKWLKALAHAAYDLEADDRRLRRILTKAVDDRASYFRNLRATYPRRRAFDTWSVSEIPFDLRNAVEAGLTIRPASTEPQ